MLPCTSEDPSEGGLTSEPQLIPSPSPSIAKISSQPAHLSFFRISYKHSPLQKYEFSVSSGSKKKLFAVIGWLELIRILICRHVGHAGGTITNCAR
jgi:hypothetical protein